VRFSPPTYIVLDMPAEVCAHVRRLRERFSPLLAPLPVEITLVGSSGVGVLASDTSSTEAFDTLERIAGETAPLSVTFGAMASFAGSGVYYFPPVDPTSWEQLHRAFATSGLRFAPSPFPFTPHLTAVNLGVAHSPELAATALSLSPPPSGETAILSMYSLEGYDCNLLYRTTLRGAA
jgi:2'-5' RNA ligase